MQNILELSKTLSRTCHCHRNQSHHASVLIGKFNPKSDSYGANVSVVTALSSSCGPVVWVWEELELQIPRLIRSAESTIGGFEDDTKAEDVHHWRNFRLVILHLPFGVTLPRMMTWVGFPLHIHQDLIDGSFTDLAWRVVIVVDDTRESSKCPLRIKVLD